MNCLGCLLILLIIAGPTFIVLILKLGVNMVASILNRIGAVAVWIYESFLNFFRTEKRELVNPFTGVTNFDEVKQDDDIAYTPTETPKKIFDASDGEYIDYTEL